jgi:hypothetical protein
LGERFNGIEEVGGSIPPGSTNKTNELTKNEILASFPNLVVSYKLATARQPLPAESSGLPSLGKRPGCRSALYPAALSFSPGLNMQHEMDSAKAIPFADF